MSTLQLLESWPVATAAAGWTTLDGRGASLGPTDVALPLASVTKPLFAYAVLVAIEEGTLDLDGPCGPPGSTVRHLLAHASGLGDDQASPLTGVERRRIYSNSGFEALGRALADASGFTVPEYLHEAVVRPLGLASTELRGSPAHGAVSSVDDLLLVAAEWLRPTLIAPETMTAATTPQYASLPGVLPGYGRHDPNPWGLGLELRGSKAPHWTGATNSTATFGHFGRAGTFVWIDPVAGAGCVALTDREFGPWAMSAWPELSDAVIAAATAPGT